MKWKDIILMSLTNLLKHKVMTVLTTVGVVVGICAIVVTVSLGLGIQQSMDAMLAGMGDLTMIQINNYSPGTKTEPLNDGMLEKIRAIPHVQTLTPTLYDNSGFQIVSGKYTYGGQVTGVYLDALEAMGYQLTKGQLPGAKAEKGTVLFGATAPYNFYNPKKQNRNMGMQTDAGGKPIDPPVDVMTDKLEIAINLQDPSKVTKKPKPQKITCVGILAEDWSKNPSPGYTIFMDVKYMKELQKEYNRINGIKEDKNKKDSYQSVAVKADSVKSVPDVEAAIKELGYETYSMETIRKPIEEQTRNTQFILGSLGAISLLVAALGIVNTMLMSIYERTREIGIMKVLGCFVGNVRAIFLMEAGAIGFIGGVVGVGLSYAISFIINMLSAQKAADGGNGGMMGIMGMAGTAQAQSSVIPPWLVLGAVAFGTLVGIIAGLYPSNRAVKISALTAIRQE